jgi:hypothetical protein
MTVPTTAGSAWRRPTSTQALNAAKPVAASAVRIPISRPVGRLLGVRPVPQLTPEPKWGNRREIANSARHATAYRMACPVSIG